MRTNVEGRSIVELALKVELVEVRPLYAHEPGLQKFFVGHLELCAKKIVTIPRQAPTKDLAGYDCK